MSVDHVIVIQARLSSTRLPQKVLSELGGTPMLERLLERLQMRDDVIVATSVQPDDDQIVDFCERANVRCVRGPLDDVLARFVLAIEEAGSPAAVVRLTADNPTVDRAAVRDALDEFRSRSDDCAGVTNHHPDRRDPYGYAVEVVRSAALLELERALPLAAPGREHVTSPLNEAGRMHPFDVGSHDAHELRWTVDFPADFAYVAAMFRALGPRFSLDEGIAWSRANPHPGLGG